MSTNEAQIWLAWPDRLTDPATLAQRHALLGDAERARYARFRHERDRHHYLIAHALLREALSHGSDTTPAAWTFITDARGKPEIAPEQNPTNLRFSLSRTDGLVVCAVVRDAAIGVDVENTTRLDDPLPLAETIFAPPEVRALTALRGDARRTHFFDFWTLKEAYAKATGQGLSLPLDRFSFTIPDHGPITIAFDAPLTDDPAAWQFALHRPGPQHRLAVAIKLL